MTPTGFINGQYESGCYVNSSFQVHSSISLTEFKNNWMAVRIYLEIISRKFWYYDSSNNKNFEIFIGGRKYLHWFIFQGQQYQEECAKLFLVFLWVTSRNVVQGTIYQPKDKLY